MKWKNGLTEEEKINRKQEWHKWFAWYPVTVRVTEDKHKIKCWLETVQRKGCLYGFGTWSWEYKEIGGSKNDDGK